MTNLTFVASLAYKVAVLQLLLPEVDYVSEQLQLPLPHPIEMRDVQKASVSSPKFGFGVSIETSNFVIAYCNNGTAQQRLNTGYLRVIQNKIEHIERFDLYPEWAKTPSLINSDGAHQLATQWLAAIDVDVKTLEQKYEHQIEQAFYWNGALSNPENERTLSPPGTNKILLPIFNVLWGDVMKGGDYPAQVRVLGTTKELMSLSLWDFSLIRRPALVVTNAIELNNIPDPPMKHLERPVEEPLTNAPGSTNSPAPRPRPFRQQIKPKQ